MSDTCSCGRSIDGGKFIGIQEDEADDGSRQWLILVNCQCGSTRVAVTVSEIARGVEQIARLRDGRMTLLGDDPRLSLRLLAMCVLLSPFIAAAEAMRILGVPCVVRKVKP